MVIKPNQIENARERLQARQDALGKVKDALAFITYPGLCARLALAVRDQILGGGDEFEAWADSDMRPNSPVRQRAVEKVTQRLERVGYQVLETKTDGHAVMVRFKVPGEP